MIKGNQNKDKKETPKQRKQQYKKGKKEQGSTVKTKRAKGMVKKK